MHFSIMRGNARRLLGNVMHRTKAFSPPVYVFSSMNTASGKSDIQSSHVSVNMDDKTGVATISLNRPPVNSLSLEVLTDLHVALEKLDKSSKGIIITSALKDVFSAGLDIRELYQPTRERLSAFWFYFQEVYIKLYGCTRPVMAATNGNAPAGGCFLAVCSDYRIMADGNFRIGANEVHLGLTPPFWFQDVIISTIGQRQASKAMQLGLLYSSQEALQVGLVDMVVPQKEVESTAQKEVQRWLKIPDHARQMTKQKMVNENMQRLLLRRDEDITTSVDLLLRDSIQKNIGAYLESLKVKVK